MTTHRCIACLTPCPANSDLCGTCTAWHHLGVAIERWSASRRPDSGELRLRHVESRLRAIEDVVIDRRGWL